jgi:hypothetical protein
MGTEVKGEERREGRRWQRTRRGRVEERRWEVLEDCAMWRKGIGGEEEEEGCYV